MNNETKLTAQELALYLGCEVEWLGERGCNLAGINTADQSFNPVGLVYSNGLTIWTPERAVKPILRPLSDMTLDEAAFCAKEMFCDEAEAPDERLTDMAKIAIRDNFGGPHLASWRIGFLITRYLMSKHFDLFGWIPAGLAIDKTKIETK